MYLNLNIQDNLNSDRSNVFDNKRTYELYVNNNIWLKIKSNFSCDMDDPGMVG